jgi:hypothetical protein
MRHAVLAFAAALALDAAACTSGSSGGNLPPPAPTCDGSCAALWSKAFTEHDTVQLSALATDAEGDLILAGTSYDGADLGAVHVGAGLFLAKLDPAGNVLWSKAFAADIHDRINGIAVDPASGEISVAGSTQSETLDLGGGALAGDPAAPWHQGIFAARLGAGGEHRWSRRFNLRSTGENDLFGAEAIAVGPSGEVVITAALAGDASIGGTTISFPSALSYAGVLIGLDASGAATFTRTFAGPDDSALPELSAVAIDGGGDIFVGGSFFGTVTLGHDTWTSRGSEDALLMRLDPTGTVRWSRALGGAAQDRVLDLAIGTDGAIYLPGFFGAGADFGTGPLSPPATDRAPLVAIYEPDGTPRSVTPLLQPELADGYATRVAASPQGGAVVLLGVGPEAPFTQIATVGADGAVGTPRTLRATNQSLDAPVLSGQLLAVDPAGHAFLAGSLRGTTDFGSGPIQSDEPTYHSAFVAKLAR